MDPRHRRPEPSPLELTEWLLRQPPPYTRGLIVNRPPAAMAELTQAEHRCCHMRDAEIDWSETAIDDWRSEFRKIPRSEHCRDCPLLNEDLPA